ncbi:hypothetical protein QWY85_03715 [Neolewinella lacunae]|uniref:Uncharacterized protein n=1 Tax=Neolewinella lacunae TaxID=1517758 RepID=A0A923PHM9_9BACT|nr:hypothetical protein [Neolewinella lacunae]MBC6992886.1 hypothetical protein [Neolewinella lacunae]MDN3633750.1 hypothetical protein [Neolewinella lacunae]
MEDRLLDKIAEPFNLKLPEYSSMEEMIEEVLPAVAKYSDPTLDDEDAAIFKTDWVLMSDQVGNTAVSLHTFRPSGEIRIAIDGAIESRSFQVVKARRIIMGYSLSRDSVLYELAFMDSDFLILRRHGNAANHKQKYVFFCSEPIGTRLTWDEALERLVGKYRDNQMPWLLVLVVILVLVGAVIYFR